MPKESTRNGASGLSDKGNSAVSFSKNKSEVNIEGESGSNDGDLQDSLAHYIPIYLSRSGEECRCCGICLPLPFERASTHSWWNPKFDSEILEGQFKQSAYQQIRLRFRYSLVYLMLMSITWSVYLLLYGFFSDGKEAFPLGVIFIIFALFCLFILWFTRSPSYRRYQSLVGAVVGISVCLLSLASIASAPVLSPAGDLAICTEIVLLLYTVLPLPLYFCFLLGITYSSVFEWLGTSGHPSLARILSHVCVHLVSLHLHVMTSVRMRGTFMKVGQSLLVRKQLETEKQLKEQMILSVMPPKVADWLLAEGGGNFDDSTRNSANSDLNSIFRPFNMSSMKDVSILFADIVGFTKMSSNKSASELVAVLNELFERFDILCYKNGCEKISTLGDCYYCVSGCPEPRTDHAFCCVQMGLSMIDAIAQFDKERKEEINMRVGVHTGTVLCGIVGRRRVKFDVWSNDVTFANKMESTGKPGRVHISQDTKNFLDDRYTYELGSPVKGVDTYFIVNRDVNRETTLVSSPSNISLGIPNFERPQSLMETDVEQSIPSQDLTPSSFQYSDVSKPNIPRLTVLKECLLDMKATSLPSVLSREVRPKSESQISLSNRSWKYSLLRVDVIEDHDIVPSNNPCVSSKIVPAKLDVPKDDISFCHSINSRKDSGIKSTSRRSSIQQQLYAMNGYSHKDLLSHRISGYYTSSHSSLNLDLEKDGMLSPQPLFDAYGECTKLRKQSDLQLIKCVRDNSKSDRSYFVSPELWPWSLKFKDEDFEKEYRERAHRTVPEEIGKVRTLATSRFNTYLDIIVAFIVFVCVCVSSFIILPVSWDWIPVFILLSCIQLLVVSVCVSSIFKPLVIPKFEKLLRWYPWQSIGAVLVSLPMVAVLSNYRHLFSSVDSLFNYCYLFYISMVHFCNCTQLNCWMKSLLATVGAIIYLILVTFTLVNVPVVNNQNSTDFIDPYANTTLQNRSNLIENVIAEKTKSPFEVASKASFLVGTVGTIALQERFKRSSDLPDVKSTVSYKKLLTSTSFLVENFLNIILLLLMVWFLNREFEISYRLSFHSNTVAVKDRARVQTMRDQADLLLHNIIPRHVANHIKNTAKYSEDVKGAGIIFASIVNFSGMYDESYMNGRECLRVLNELISDFDELLGEPRFSMVEKIKTIGSTFMAASGLNLSEREGNEHLHQLMEFALALQMAIANFNAHLLEFSLLLRIGYNVGDVTAGVVGTKKLFYDIWGDAVNIASRMDSTGLPGRIQVPTDIVNLLSEWYVFEPRGTVFVKGKDNMDVSLLAGPKALDFTSVPSRV